MVVVVQPRTRLVLRVLDTDLIRSEHMGLFDQNRCLTREINGLRSGVMLHRVATHARLSKQIFHVRDLKKTVPL